MYICIINQRENFIKKAQKKHNGKYDYSCVDYQGSKKYVDIICAEHGKFRQMPSSHLRGCGCPLCGKAKQGRHMSQDEFITRSNKVHNHKYGYSKVKYISQNKKVIIICPEHGDFEQLPSSHLSGSGCPKCKGRGLTLNELKYEFDKIHGGKYDYSKIEQKKLNDKITIICPKHGEFQQSASKHLQGQGCPICAKLKVKEYNTLTKEDFIQRALLVHNGDRYDYSNVEYLSMRDKVEIICSKHGSFSQLPYDHINGHGCPICGNNVSNAELEIIEFLKTCDNHIEIEQHCRSIINGKEIDICLPEYKLGIEYNGLRWHSEQFKNDKYYHIDKLNASIKNEVGLIQIFEDEWINKKDIVKEKLRHLIKKDFF